MSGWINPGQFVTAQSERITTPSNQIRGGYSRLTQALLQAQGIPAMYIGGTANGFSGWPKDGKINHGWSAAFIDGEWIYIDSTWGRSSGTPAVGSEFTLNPSRFDEDALMFSRDHLGKTIFADPQRPALRKRRLHRRRRRHALLPGAGRNPGGDTLRTGPERFAGGLPQQYHPRGILPADGQSRGEENREEYLRLSLLQGPDGIQPLRRHEQRRGRFRKAPPRSRTRFSACRQDARGPRSPGGGCRRRS